MQNRQSTGKGDHMRYLMMAKSTGDTPDENLYAEMAKFIEELTAAGVLLATGGLDPAGTRVVSSGADITVTDGPFAETKESVGGFALVEVRSKEEAVELTRRFRKIVGDGESMIHQVFS
ncbi:MAG: YciI family protein [Kibdelosporangium sp.]